MGLEDVEDQLTAEALQVVQAEEDLGMQWTEAVEPGLVLEQLVDPEDAGQGAGHLTHRAEEGEAVLVQRLPDHLVPVLEHLVGLERAGAQVGVPRRQDLELMGGHPVVDVEVETQLVEHRLGIRGIDHAEALVARGEAGSQVGDEHPVAVAKAAVEGTDVVARGDPQPWDAEIDRHGPPYSHVR
jgi:hypothetical protein